MTDLLAHNQRLIPLSQVTPFRFFPLPGRLATGAESQRHGRPSRVAKDSTPPQRPSNRLRDHCGRHLSQRETTYPDLYTAIGVHSGLACGAANDLPSAFVAMRRGELSGSSGAGDTSEVPGYGSAVPTIVFHGDRDSTVHPRNGDHVIAQKRSTDLQKTVHRGRVPGGNSYTRTIHTDTSGRASIACAHSHRLLAERGAGTTSPSGVIPFRNLKRSLPVERTRVVFSAMMDLYDCMVRVNS